ncbi:unnamed protein product, partial [Meganyctiphanes norvegica]
NKKKKIEMPSMRRSILGGGPPPEYNYGDSEEEIPPLIFGDDVIKKSCSGKNCAKLGGKCVKKSNKYDNPYGGNDKKCKDDICGSRYFLSPCPCSEDKCCCMPLTCPAHGSKEASKCAAAAGSCRFKDEKCDGECLPLCGPSCSCCISGCKNLGSSCGEIGEGKCKLKCEEGE